MQFCVTRSYPPRNMVKRACPFHEDMNPQVKIHVRDKEVANGVLKNQHMKQVYDKTKELLFLGAKRASTALPPMEPSILVRGPKITSVPQTYQPLKQLQLTRHGKLSSSSNMQVLAACETLCSKCSVSNLTEMYPCSFCDVPLCPACTQHCDRCHDYFCAACSFCMYDNSTGFICRNCC